MKDWIRQVFVLCVLMVFLAGCTTVPITGRSQFNTVPDSLINSMALQEYNTFLKSPENKLSTDPEKTAMVQRVGDRIADAVERYMNENGHADLIADYQWEFNLIDSDQKNAWAMPGGKVVVYTGILEVAQDDAGLAVVMGHEIAHAIARHGAERMTQGLTITLGGVALDKALEDEPSATRNIFLTSYGLGATIGVMLPYSRTHETEADRLGLIFMAMAGYAPEEAVGFWQRMAQSKDGTHPADETRIRNIKADLYEARRYYRPYKPAIE
ncbi:MAG: M48 family metallopeptidase [Planctomycetota bacterium]|jgi:predicted Zn-dependent protease